MKDGKALFQEILFASSIPCLVNDLAMASHPYSLAIYRLVADTEVQVI